MIIVFLLTAAFLLYKTLNPSTPEWITAVVEKGTVSEVVSVSGFVEAKRTADLSFPSTGIVTDVIVEEGAVVKQGDIIATLAATELVAQRSEAVAALTKAKATYAKVVAGPRSETVAVAKTNLTNSEESLRRITAEENQKVANARTALLSTGLTAAAIDIDEASTPPIISGTYSCKTESVYDLKVYSSGEKSGYSYTYTGPESGTGAVSFDQPSPLGNCGLYLLFTEGDFYSNSKWQIEVPNTRGSSYATLNNTYSLTLTQAENAIAAAKNALALARNETVLSTAPARSFDVTEALAATSETEARIAAIDAKIADRSIVAPFDGIITDINITKGESAPLTSVITILANNAFTLKARIPEIDITKLNQGQKIKAVFDARSTETLSGEVSYISPIATQIDGVAYFETTITLNEIPSWLRAGLNADIDIITQSFDQVLRLPKRFVLEGADGSHIVLLPQGNKTASTTIEVLFTGNDSYLHISGLSEGTVVVAP